MRGTAKPSVPGARVPLRFHLLSCCRRKVNAVIHDRIVLDPAILAGKPVIRGSRLSVEFVIGLLADGWSEAEIAANYPAIGHDDILACLAYAHDMLRDERIYPSAA